MKNNMLRNFLRLIAAVWCCGLTIFVMSIMLCRTDLVIDLLTSKAVICVLCIVVSGGIGFIVGTIVCSLRTAHLIEAREKKISNLEHDLKKTKSDLNEACKIIKKFSKQHQKQLSQEENNRRNDILSQIVGLSDPIEEPVEEETDLQEEEFDDTLSDTESET